MSTTSIVEALFPKEHISGSASEILDQLSCLGIRNLAYGGDCGCDPGYIFRGELGFETPLQCSLELRLRKELKDGAALTAAQIQKSEQRFVSDFILGDGGRVAAIIDTQNGQNISQSKEDVFWWLSLMRHYGHPTRLIDFTRDIRLALFFAIEQLLERREKREDEKDLMIYCFPCNDWSQTGAERSNKTPIAPSEKGIDMSRAVGCLINLEWMRRHCISEQRANQLFGWDRPSYQNPRLRFQKGLFVFPYDYPKSSLKNGDPSWLVQNLNAMAPDYFNMNRAVNGLPAKRLRIPASSAAELKDILENSYRLTPATVYVDYSKVRV